MAEKIFHLRGGEISGRAAAPVKLNHGAIFRNALADVLDFSFQRGEVGNRDAFVLLDRNVAGAEKTEALAEGKMHVERKRSASLFGARVIILEIVGPKSSFQTGAVG